MNYTDTELTYIIAFCPDTDSFFVTNQRYFYYECPLIEFENEDRCISYFEQHIFEFLAIRNQIMRGFGQKESNRIYLENTKRSYEWTIKNIFKEKKNKK